MDMPVGKLNKTTNEELTLRLMEMIGVLGEQAGNRNRKITFHIKRDEMGYLSEIEVEESFNG